MVIVGTSLPCQELLSLRLDLWSKLRKNIARNFYPSAMKLKSCFYFANELTFRARKMKIIQLENWGSSGYKLYVL